MKKLLGMLVMFGLLIGVGKFVFAGIPQEQNGLQPANPYSNTSIVGSTYTTVGTVNLTASVVPGTIFNGTTISCRNCFTKFLVQIPTTTIISVLDGGTTVQTIDGQGLGSSGVNTLALPEDHLGPLCLTAGNTSTFNFVTANGVSTNHQGINYEGYTQCGTPNQAGLMH